MINRIKKYIVFLANKNKFSEDYKNELINVCLIEYEGALNNGLSKKEAFEYAIKDVKQEYSNINYKDINFIEDCIINNIIYICTLFITFIYVGCNHFLSWEKFSCSILVFFLPNFCFLFIYFIIKNIFRGNFLKESLFLLNSLSLYLPIIIVELLGEKVSIGNYIISLNILIFIKSFIKLLKIRKFDKYLIMLVISSLMIFIGYLTVLNNFLILELVVKIINLLLFLVFGISFLLKKKYNKNDFIIISIFIILLLCLLMVNNNMQIFDKLSIISLILLICNFLFVLFKPNLTRKYLYLKKLYLVLSSLILLVNTFVYLIMFIEIGHTINERLLICMSLFLLLCVFDKCIYYIYENRGEII